MNLYWSDNSDICSVQSVSMYCRVCVYIRFMYKCSKRVFWLFEYNWEFLCKIKTFFIDGQCVSAAVIGGLKFKYGCTAI